MEDEAVSLLTSTPRAATDDLHSAIVSRATFSALDYCLFAAMLAASTFIGVHFAFFAKQKQNTAAEYLLGGKNVALAPVAMSLTASYVSGITLLGVPAEIYTYGTQFCTIMIGMAIAGLCGGLFFIPVFYRLDLSTSYEYLGLRFDRKVQLLGSIMFLLNCMLYIPVVIYVPALAFSQVSGINLHLISPIVCLVCIFYTSLGGLKAVVWTDALQIIIMFGSIFTVMAIGTHSIGGFETVWQRNEDAGRIEFFNTSPSPTIRHTFWNTAFGCTFNWIYHCSVNQGMVQRFLVMPNITRSQILMALFLIGVFILTSVSSYNGLLIFATYHDCDRLSTKEVTAADQLLPYFVMDVAGSVPGLPGLFMAGIFSAALSSMSTGLNSMSGVIYENFIVPSLGEKMSEKRASFLMKVMCVIIGVICVAMVFVVEHLRGVIEVAWALEGITSGPMLSMFVMGMFLPWTNSTGAFSGGVVGLITMAIVCFGNQFALSSGRIHIPRKPVSVDGCTVPPNSTIPTAMMESVIDANTLLGNTFNQSQELGIEDDDTWAIFRVSYTLYCIMGFLISISVGLLVTAITGPTSSSDVHIDHLSPAIRPFINEHRYKGGHHKQNESGVEILNLLQKQESILNSEDKKMAHT